MSAIVTYHDLDGSAPRVTWRGVSFVDGMPVTVDDDGLIEAARKNAFFEVAAAPTSAGDDVVDPQTDGEPTDEFSTMKRGDLFAFLKSKGVSAAPPITGAALRALARTARDAQP